MDELLLAAAEIGAAVTIFLGLSLLLVLGFDWFHYCPPDVIVERVPTNEIEFDFPVWTDA